MATIGGNELWIGSRPYSAGGAFRLTEPAKKTRTVSDPGGQIFSLAEGSSYAVIALPSAPKPSELFTIVHETLQRELDRLSVHGYGHYAMASGIDSNLIWWRRDGRTTLRLYDTLVMNFSGSAVLATVIRADGSVQPPVPEQIPSWRPAFRYFRLSQIATDIFDSYRNLYLALEAILSERVPARTVTGDTNWTRHALNALVSGGIDLTPYVSKKTGDPVESFLREQYKASRCAIFHAKSDQRPLLPGYLNDRKKVVRAHEHLSGLITHLLTRLYNAHPGGGGITYYGFSQTIKSLGSSAWLGVTAKPASEDDGNLEGIGDWGDVSPLKTTYGGPVDVDKQGSEHEFIGRSKISELHSTTVNSFLFVLSDGKIGAYSNVESLVLNAVDTLEISLVLAMNNPQMPRSRFVF